MFEGIIPAQAKLRPHSVAYCDGFRQFTFAQMADDIARCTTWLQAHRLPPGSRVILQFQALYRYWVLFFALEASNLLAVPVPSLAPLDPDFVKFLRADHYLTDQPLREAPAIPGAYCDRGWLTRVRRFRALPLPQRQRSPRDAVCVLLSSGTTGSPKKVLLTRAVIDAHLIDDESCGLYVDSVRVMMLLPGSSIAGFRTPLATWKSGGALCLWLKESTARAALDSLRVTVITGAPTHFDALLRALPADFVPTQPINIRVGGGMLTGTMASEMRHKLRGAIICGYGSTEMGTVARANHELLADTENAVGFVLPGVEVTIVAENGRSLPYGEIGEIRVRGPRVVKGYLEHPEQDTISFHDGWYSPGDLGGLRADGLLTIHGRVDNLMNFGGKKVLPERIEGAIMGLGLVHDVAALATRDAGREILRIAYVADRVVDPERLAKVIPTGIQFSTLRVAALPRNAMGKLERKTLHRAFLKTSSPASSADRGLQRAVDRRLG